ncbi:hypothetical protein VYF65_002839 [Lysinibacillus irui]|uniref:hypothetical protein n=1 Tax=Lysinibacillus irui TaxID=2998077 RepID=UPI00388AB213
MNKDKKQSKKRGSKVIYGTTPEERFKEVHGMTIEEWQAKEEEMFKAKTGMSSDEWYRQQVNSSTPMII